MERAIREERADEPRATDLRTDGDVVRRRVLAFLADAALVTGAVFAVAGRFVRSRLPRLALTAAGSAVAGLFYHVLLEGTFGRTPGKTLFAIAVRREGGQPCTYTAATIRTLLRVVDWLPVASLVGLASIRLTERHQRVGDLLAGTVVVRTARGRHGGRD